jgi:hypothetical protein
VRGFEGDWLVLEPHVVPADAAAVFIGEQDLIAERRIAVTRGRPRLDTAQNKLS